MRRRYRRESSWSKWFTGRRRLVAAAATLVAFGGIVTVTQVSDASTKRSTQRALSACDNIQAPRSTKLSTETRQGTWTTNKGQVTQHADDGAGDVPSAAEMRDRCRDWVMRNVANNDGDDQQQSGQQGQNGQQGGQQQGGQQQGGQQQGGQNGGQQQGGQNGGQQQGGNNNGGNNNNGQNPPPGAGLGVLTNSCENTQLQPHDGFQKGDRCVSTEFGEVGAAANNPSLLIVEAPRQVAAGQAFSLKVSTRNLIRDRFLAAGQGGYYVESSVLQGGIVRGHFHTACRMLQTTDAAPAPEPVPAFFVATEDKQGGRGADTVTINVPGLPQEGIAQCASWAGDGSHRIPMMERANQTPALDAVRIQVAGNNNGGQQGGNNNGGQQGGNNNGGQQGGNDNGGQQGGNDNGGQQGGNNNGGQQGGNDNGGQQGGNDNGGQQGNNNGGQQGGNDNGGQQGGNDNGGQQGGNNNGGQQQGTNGGVSTKGVIVRTNPPTTAPTRKPTVTSDTKSDDAAQADSDSAGDQGGKEKAVPEPTVTKKRTATTDSDTAEEVEARSDKTTPAADVELDPALDPEAAPDAQPVAQADQQVAAPTAGNKLALTGANTMALVGVGVVLLLAGFAIAGSVRRRRAAESGWR
ncbi:hypothetical protein EV385_1272 [Krasilnikovia cinnamomea]|uniref:LPXTG-motif cell wall-anchored protein n=1 Tax=Krasilnikovia cinnamomea TaxID=349313 RepID=A0A4Q7ZHG5_9ACTN|nr:hypothetical protein EV385_1272 [Krasilnikovia cinnamomea]